MTSKKEYQQIIYDEIMVDCYGEEEEIAAWDVYLGDNLLFPFTAEFPVKKKDKTIEWVKGEIVGVKDESYNGGTYYVEAEYKGVLIPVDILALKNIKTDKENRQVIEMWRYWNER
jgi:hypothetical protein